VAEHDRVVVHVDDARVGRGALRHLVGVVAAGQAGADVEELADARLGGQIVDRAAEEGAVLPDARDDVRILLDHQLGGLAVRLEVVLAAEPVIVDPRDRRHAGVDLRRRVRLILRHGVRSLSWNRLPADYLITAGARDNADGDQGRFAAVR
jgi:hypothetical protein